MDGAALAALLRPGTPAPDGGMGTSLVERGCPSARVSRPSAMAAKKPAKSGKDWMRGEVAQLKKG